MTHSPLRPLAIERARSATFRPDIEGLRAVAVLSVLVYHAGLPVTGGYVGVDVFFVISGFLITALLLREVENTGKISLLGFYARRAKRLLPAASLVLVVTIPLSFWFAPHADHPVFALDVVAAAAYFVNWRFAERSVDYLAQDVGRSPVLHFWSLSVEEQFYFIWPLLIIVAAFLAKRLARRIRPTTALALSLVLCPSLVWSIWFTNHSQSEAFFVTTTRLWELGIGALTALGLPLATRLYERVSQPLVWLGSGLILGAALWFDNKTAWPGYWATLPTLGTALVIVGGSCGASGWLSRALASRPMVWVGGLSYSVYLWHWPVIVLGQDWLGLKGAVWAVALVAGSFLPAWLSYRFVERPLRFSGSLAESPVMTLSLGANLSLFAVVAGLVLTKTLHDGDEGASKSEGQVELDARGGRVVASPPSAGAGALGNDPTKSTAGKPRKQYTRMFPTASEATKDVPRAYAEGCQARFPDVEPKWCEIGDRAGERRVVMLGDSKILQYYEALDTIGKAAGWKISTATKSACPSTDAVKLNEGRPYDACSEFNQKVMEQLEHDPPYMVITSQVSFAGFMPGQKPVPTKEGMVAGLASRWAKLRKLGAEVVVVLDNPHPGDQVYKCLEKHADNAARCAFDRKRGVDKSAAPTLLAAAAKVPGVKLVDLTDHICPQNRCAPVIGGVLVYRQGSHITNTYAKSLAPVLSKKLLAIE